MTVTLPVRSPALAARVSGVVFDCGDPAALSWFWGALLGRRVAAASGGWAELEPEPGGIDIGFHHVGWFRRPRRRWPRVPQQMHLDVRVPDVSSAAEAAVGLGARVLSDVQDADGTPWLVLEDPAGHPFCLVTG